MMPLHYVRPRKPSLGSKTLTERQSYCLRPARLSLSWLAPLTWCYCPKSARSVLYCLAQVFTIIKPAWQHFNLWQIKTQLARALSACQMLLLKAPPLPRAVQQNSMKEQNFHNKASMEQHQDPL